MATSVDAEVLECGAEVEAVQPHLGVPTQELPLKDGHHDEDLLGDGEDEGAACGGGGEVLGKADSRDALVILLLEHAPIVGVRCGGDHAHDALQLEACAFRGVAEDHGGGAHAEEAVGQQHRSLRADVVLQRQDLRGHDEHVRAVRRHLEEVPGEADRDEPRAAPHP
jgi:hypothetical protein